MKTITRFCSHARLLWVLTLLIMASGVADAQYMGRGRSRYSNNRSYADVVELTVREPGMLEESIRPDMHDRVRLLRVEGRINEKDLEYIKKLANRNKVVNERGRHVDNVLDVDLEYADIVGRHSYSSERDRLPKDIFEGCDHLRSIVLPSRLREIEKRAFANCYELEEVYIPDGVTTLHSEVFRNCNRLTTVTMPARLAVIGKECFYGCKQLRDVALPAAMREIGAGAFQNTAITSIYIPDGVTIIGRGAFANTAVDQLVIPRSATIEDNFLGYLPQLRQIDVAQGNRYYSSYGGVLYDASGATLIRYPVKRSGSYNVPEGVTAICPWAFENNEQLTAVTLPSSLAAIGEGAFSGCSALREIFIPMGVTTIGANAFYRCSRLAEITMPEAVTRIGKATFKNTAISTIDLPMGLVEIDEDAFRGCDRLQYITLPITLKEIGDHAFAGSGLRHVTIPENVKKIGKDVFDKCDAMESIDVLAPVPPELEKTFDKKVTVYVPAESFDLYKKEKNWKKQKSLQAK